MTFLLDTHIVLWALSDPGALTEETRQEIQDPHKVVFVSAASIWEIVIKKALGKLKVPSDLESILQATHFSPLPISWSHATAVNQLPLHHRDPFDRMLVAQAQVEGLTLLTHDHKLASYGTFVRLV